MLCVPHSRLNAITSKIFIGAGGPPASRSIFSLTALAVRNVTNDLIPIQFRRSNSQPIASF